MRPFFAFVLVTLVGCTPKIGDHCSQSTDCSQLGDRLCDTSQPNGYCTVFNCEPDGCTDAACVAFHDTLDPGCAQSVQWPRFERTFCMKTCSSDDDCRVADGYRCVAPADYAAKIVDLLPKGSQICLYAPTAAMSTPPATPPGVCTSSSSGASSSTSSSSSSSAASSTASSSSASSSSGAGGAGGGAGGKGGASAGGAGGKGGTGGKGGA